MPRSFEFDVFVAVSDNGIINREFEGSLDELCKADQLTIKVKDLLLKKMKSTIKDLIKIDLAKQIVLNLSNSKKVKKVQVKVKENRALYAIKADKESLLKCSKCGSAKIQVEYGRSYYFKCSSCKGNTSLKKWLVCVSPQCKPKIRKAKNDYFKECSICESSTIFFQNKLID